MDKNKTDITDRMLGFARALYYRTDNGMERLTSGVAGRKWSWIAVIILCFAPILILNILTPIISDDYTYLFIWGELARVQSLSDVVQSQINHYFAWGGRSVVHFIAQVLLLLPSALADVLNSLVFSIYAFLVYLHIKGRGEGSISLYVLVNLAIWCFQPVIGDTVLWLTGAANYLWGTVIILLFLLPFRFYDGNKAGVASMIVASLVMLLLGVIAGWTNENTAGAMILLAFFFIIRYKSKGCEIPVWSFAGLLGAVAGYCFMILAPGNYERGGDAASLSLFILAFRFVNWTLTFIYNCAPLVMLALILFIVHNHFHKECKNEGVKLGLIYVLGAIAAVYAMLFAPSFPRRALFGVVTFLIIGGGIWFYRLDFQKPFLRQIRFAAMMFGIVYFLFTFYVAVREINAYRDIVAEREVAIHQAKEAGIAVCEFERYDGGLYIHGEDPFSQVSMSRYYGIEIRFREK